MKESAVFAAPMTAAGQESGYKRWLAAILLMSFANLLLELSLTRLFSVILFYHFAFLAISIALIIILITLLRVHAFLALILAAITAGLLAKPGTLPGEGPESWGGGVNLRKNHRKNWNAQTPSANAPDVNFKSFGLAVLAVKIAKVDFQICRYKMAE